MCLGGWTFSCLWECKLCSLFESVRIGLCLGGLTLSCVCECKECPVFG